MSKTSHYSLSAFNEQYTHSLELSGDSFDPRQFSFYETITKIIAGVLSDNTKCGYTNSIGIQSCRESIATILSTFNFKVPKTQNLMLSLGEHWALHLLVRAMCNPGDNIVVAKQSNNYLFEVGKFVGIEVREFQLDPINNWSFKNEDIEALIDEKTKFIYFNNPEGVFSKNFTEEEIQRLVDISNNKKVVLVSDECYFQIVADNLKFTSLSQYADQLPFIIIGSVSKIYHAEGLKVGFIAFYDYQDCLKQIKEGFESLSQITLHPASYAQYAIPEIIQQISITQILKETINYIQERYHFLKEQISKTKYIEVLPYQAGFNVCLRYPIDKYSDIEGQKLFIYLLAELDIKTIKLFTDEKYEYVSVNLGVQKGILNEFLLRITNRKSLI